MILCSHLYVYLLKLAVTKKRFSSFTLPLYNIPYISVPQVLCILVPADNVSTVLVNIVSQYLHAPKILQNITSIPTATQGELAGGHVSCSV